MNEVNFSVRISEARATKAAIYLARRNKSRKELVEHVIDNIDRMRPALDATCSTRKTMGRKK